MSKRTTTTSKELTEAFKILSRVRTRRTRRRPQPKTGMNQAEAQYAAYLAGHPEVVKFEYEKMSLKLAKGCWLTPDFCVEYTDGTLKVVDVKKVWRGKDAPHAEDDALVKLKMAGQASGQWFAVVMTWFDPQTGVWKERAFEPMEDAADA